MSRTRHYFLVTKWGNCGGTRLRLIQDFRGGLNLAQKICKTEVLSNAISGILRPSHYVIMSLFNLVGSNDPPTPPPPPLPSPLDPAQHSIFTCILQISMLDPGEGVQKVFCGASRLPLMVPPLTLLYFILTDNVPLLNAFNWKRSPFRYFHNWPILWINDKNSRVFLLFSCFAWKMKWYGHACILLKAKGSQQWTAVSLLLELISIV